MRPTGGEGGAAPRAWPEGRRAALSLTFDDGDPSQLRHAVPVLGEAGLRATFYPLPEVIRPDAAAWRTVAASGHEIGNHTLTHPCSGNFPWSRRNALEQLTMARIGQELAWADLALERLTGHRPVTFAYPCGQRTVGRGRRTRSYVPLVAGRYLAGRGHRDEVAADPAHVDLAQVPGVHADGQPAATLHRLVDAAVEDGRWLVLAAHKLADGPPAPFTLGVGQLRSVCAYAEGITELWVDTVAAVAAHLAKARLTSTMIEGAGSRR